MSFRSAGRAGVYFSFSRHFGLRPSNVVPRFFLWDTQGAELHFIDKLWPQLTEVDWLNSLGNFSQREIRGGK